MKHFIIPNVGLFHVKHFGQFTSAEVFASAFIFSGFDRSLRKPLSGQQSGETTREGTGKKECGAAEDAFLCDGADGGDRFQLRRGWRKKDGGDRFQLRREGGEKHGTAKTVPGAECRNPVAAVVAGGRNAFHRGGAAEKNARRQKPFPDSGAAEKSLSGREFMYLPFPPTRTPLQGRFFRR